MERIVSKSGSFSTIESQCSCHKTLSEREGFLRCMTVLTLLFLPESGFSSFFFFFWKPLIKQYKLSQIRMDSWGFSG